MVVPLMRQKTQVRVKCKGEACQARLTQTTFERSSSRANGWQAPWLKRGLAQSLHKRQTEPGVWRRNFKAHEFVSKNHKINSPFNIRPLASCRNRGLMR